MAHLIGAFLLICSFFFIPGQELRPTQQMFFQAGCSVILMCFLFFNNIQKHKANKVNLWVGIFTVYSTLLIMLNGGRYGSNILINTLLGGSLFIIIQGLDKSKTKLILFYTILVCLANMVYMAFQAVGFDFLFKVSVPGGAIENINVDLCGLLALKAIMGMWMGVGLLATLVINPWLSLAYVVPIYISKASGALFGVICGVLIYFYYIKRLLFKILFPILIVAGLSYVVFVDSPMGMMGTRVALWKEMLRNVAYSSGAVTDSRFLRNPITGFGVDSFKSGRVKYFTVSGTTEIRRTFWKDNGMLIDQTIHKPFVTHGGQICTPDKKKVDYWDNPHNGLIHLIYEYGLAGLFIVCMIIYHLIVRIRQSIKTPQLMACVAILTSLMAASVSQFPMYLARIGVLFPIVMGLIMVNTDD